MPTSMYYRRDRHVVSFHQMPPLFKLVDNAWSLVAPTVRETVAPHSTRDGNAWTHTLTYEFAVQIPNGPPGFNRRTLRGHVHYIPNGNSYRAVPGSYWVEGVMNCDARTPLAIVTRFQDRNVDLEGSGLANIGDVFG